MKRKAISLLLTAALLLAATGCAKESVQGDTGTTPPSAPDVQATTTADEAPDETTADEAPAETTADEAPTAISEDQAKQLAEDLLEKNEFVVSLLGKANLTVDYDAAIDVGELQYAPLSAEYGFTCVDDIKLYLDNIYTADYYATTYFNTFFEGDYAMYIDVDGILYMNISGGGAGGNKWAYETMTVSALTETSFSISVDGQDNYDSPMHAEMTVVLEGGNWLINELTSDYIDG